MRLYATHITRLTPTIRPISGWGRRWRSWLEVAVLGMVLLLAGQEIRQAGAGEECVSMDRNSFAVTVKSGSPAAGEIFLNPQKRDGVAVPCSAAASLSAIGQDENLATSSRDRRTLHRQRAFLQPTLIQLQ